MTTSATLIGTLTSLRFVSLGFLHTTHNTVQFHLLLWALRDKLSCVAWPDVYFYGHCCLSKKQNIRFPCWSYLCVHAVYQLQPVFQINTPVLINPLAYQTLLFLLSHFRYSPESWGAWISLWGPVRWWYHVMSPMPTTSAMWCFGSRPSWLVCSY